MTNDISKSSLTKKIDFWNVPIFIVSYNRKDDLKKLIDRLLSDGYKNLLILDNHSSDKKLLDYLAVLEKKQSKYIKIYRLNKNWGHRVLWECHLFDEVIENQYYVLTDPDIIPIEECPNDYVQKFYEIIQKYPQKTKVGFALKIDDLPETYPYKYDIIRTESFYWEKRLPYDFTIYDAPIDTTFALYRPQKMKATKFYDGIRTGGLYQARHLGWYEIKDISGDSYYNSKNDYSTSFNKKFIEASQVSVISQLIDRQDLKFRTLVRRIFSTQILTEKYNIFDISLGLMIILAKKIVGMLHLR